MYSWCPQLLHMAGERQGNSCGNPQLKNWQNITGTTESESVHYSQPNANRMHNSAVKEKVKKHAETDTMQEVSIITALHARSSKKNRVLSHMDSAALSSKCIWKKLGLNQGLNQNLFFKECKSSSWHVETGSSHCCHTRFNRSKIFSSTCRRALDWFSQAH